MTKQLIYDSCVAGSPASVINIGEKSATCTTAREGKQVTTVEDAERRLDAALLSMTYTTLERFRENFELFHRVLGDLRPSKLELASPEMRELLQRLDAHRDEILDLHETLARLSVDTQLRRSYIDHSTKTFPLDAALLQRF
ncbi:MAG: hypothetical protein ACE5IL_18150, partial [Myxococcota bacterium]